MSTQSILRNIVIEDEKSAAVFVEALEKAEKAAAQTKITTNIQVKEVKGKELKAYFG